VSFIGELFNVDVIKGPVIKVCAKSMFENFLNSYLINELNEAHDQLEGIVVLYDKGLFLKFILKIKKNI